MSIIGLMHCDINHANELKKTPFAHQFAFIDELLDSNQADEVLKTYFYTEFDHS